VILDQTLETSRIGKTLRDQESDCDRELVFLRRNPAVDILKECWECRLFEWFLKIFVSDRERSGTLIDKNVGKNDYLLVSLLMTSMYFFMSSTSAGSLALKIVKGDTGAPSSTKLPPGWRRPPTRIISKSASAYLRNSRVDPA